MVSPSPTTKHRQPSSGSRSPSTVSLLGPEARGSLSLSRLDSPVTTLRPSTPTYGAGDRSSTRLDLSRTDLMHGLLDVGETEISSLRSSIEELRSSVRDLQRQAKQAPRTWRNELETAIDGCQAKAATSQQDALETAVKDLRSEVDARLEQATRASARRCAAIEDSLEALRVSSAAQTSALRSELSAAVDALATAGPMEAVTVMQAHGGAQLESRFALLEQQIETLKVSAATSGMRANSPQRADRKVEAVEQKVSQLEARLKDYRSQTSDQVHELKSALNSQEVMAQMEDLRDQNSEALRTAAANIATLEGSVDSWRQRMDRALKETEQRLSQEVEKRLQPVQDRVVQDIKGVTGALAAEAESLRGKMEQRIADEFRQISGQIQSVHSTALQNHESMGNNVSGLLQRLGAAEISMAEEQGKRELMKRHLEERLDQVANSRTQHRPSEEAREGAEPGSPRTRETARVAVQLEVHDKEMKRLAKEFQSQAKILDRLSEQQRRLAQEQATDVSRHESSRLEERKGTEKSEKRLKARLEELEARLEIMQSGSPKAIARLESHRFDKVPEASIADVVRSLEEQRAVLAEHDARQQNAQKLFSQLEKSAQDVQPLLQRKLADHDARLEQQGQEAAQLGRLHKELKTQLESQKDVLEIRCLEKLEAQGKRMEEVSHRLEQLEDTSRSTVHQVKQVGDLEKRTDRLEDWEKRAQRVEQQLTEVTELLSASDAKLGQQSRELKRELVQMSEKQEQLEQRQGDHEQKNHVLQQDLEQLKESHGQLTSTCNGAKAEIAKQGKTLGQVDIGSESIAQRAQRVEASIASLTPRLCFVEETVKDLIQELTTRLRGLDGTLGAMEPRLSAVESQMPRLQDVLKTVAILQADQKTGDETSAARFDRIEASVAKLSADAEKSTEFTERMRGWVEKMDDKTQRLGSTIAKLEDSRVSTEALVARSEVDFAGVRDQLENATTRVANFEFRLTAFDVRLCTVEPLSDMNVKLCSMEPRIAKLEQLEVGVSRLEPAVQELVARFSGCEARASSLESSVQKLTATSDNLRADQKALAHQVDDQQLMLEDARTETAAFKEEAKKLNSQAQAMQRGLEQTGKTQHNLQSDLTELQQNLEQVQQRLKTDLRGNEDRLIESMQEVDSQVTRRLEDTRTTIDKQSRALTLLQHSSKDLERAMEGLKRQVEDEKGAASQAAAAAQLAAEEAAEAAKGTCEASKALLSEHSERQGSLAQDFEKWSHQAQEEAAARVLQAHEAAITDMLKTMDRHRWQTKEDALKTREELMTVMKSNTKVFDGKVAEIRGRLQLLAAEAGRSLEDLNLDVERLRRGDSSLFQESTVESPSQGASGSLPGLRELRHAVSDEIRRRDQEPQRISERLKEYTEDSTIPGPSRLSQFQEESQSQSNKASPMAFTVLDGLRGCEAAISAMDRRVTKLEDCVEDRLYDMVRFDVGKHAAMQQGHLYEMGQKMDKLVHTLHTPSGHENATTAQLSAGAGPLGSRESWRQQFRSALSDSTYVQRALKTNRRASGEDPQG